MNYDGTVVADNVGSISGASTNALNANASALPIASGRGGYTVSNTGGSGGAITITCGNGGASTSTGTGGSGGAQTMLAGTGGSSVGGTGGSGGVATVQAGSGGSGVTGGNGGVASLVAGAGANTNGSGGSVRLHPGAGNGTGVSGAVIRRIPDMSNTGIVTAAVLSAKQLLSGYMDFAGGAGVNVTTCAGNLLSAAIPNAAVGDTFETFIVNSATGTVTVAGGVGVTVLGAGTVATTKSGRAVFICTGANTWNCIITSSS